MSNLDNINTKIDLLGNDRETAKYKNRLTDKLEISPLAVNIFIAFLVLATIMLFVLQFVGVDKPAGKMKAPPGYEVVYPQDGPPRLERSKASAIIF